jgi:hypothetical protein
MEEIVQNEIFSIESRKKLSIFLKIMEEKADLDENYALNLEKISKYFTSLIDSRCTLEISTVLILFFSYASIGYASLKSDFMLIYEHFRRLAYLSRNESEILKEVLSKQANESDKILIEQKKMEKDLKILAVDVENV